MPETTPKTPKIRKSELQGVYELMQSVASTAAASKEVAPLMPAVIIKIVNEVVKQANLMKELIKAEAAIPEMLKKINAIKPPEYKKYRLQDPRRRLEMQTLNTPKVTVPKTDVLSQKITVNIPNTTQINPKAINIPNTTQINPSSG